MTFVHGDYDYDGIARMFFARQTPCPTLKTGEAPLMIDYPPDIENSLRRDHREKKQQQQQQPAASQKAAEITTPPLFRKQTGTLSCALWAFFSVRHKASAWKCKTESPPEAEVRLCSYSAMRGNRWCTMGWA